MSKTQHDASSVCRDAFAILSGVTRIEYRDGQAWELEDDDEEHPLVPRLRAASVRALIEDPPDVAVGVDVNSELQNQLREERRVNDALRNLVVAVQEVCEARGLKPGAKGADVLGFLDQNLRAVDAA